MNSASQTQDYILKMLQKLM